MKRCVLLSGGLDSALCLSVALREGAGETFALFVDYGQPYAAPEKVAAQDFASQRVQLIMEQGSTIACDAYGTFKERNLRLLDAAKRQGAEVAYFGTRCPWPMFDRHGDGNAVTLRAYAKRIGLQLRLPALWLPKFIVRRRVARAFPGVAAYSTEGWRP